METAEGIKRMDTADGITRMDTADEIKRLEVKEVDRMDKDGNSIHQLEVNGLILPVLPGLPQRLAQLSHFRPQQTDVFLFAFPKSGTHWTWEITNMLLRGRSDYVTHGKDQIMFEFVDQDVIDSKPQPRVINSHLPFHYVPERILLNGNKIIHVMRNPKDVAVSCYMHHYNMHAVWKYDGRWPAYLQLFLEGKVGWCYEGDGWFGYVREWEKAKQRNPDVSMLFIYYEDLQQDPMGTIKILADFLGVHYEDTFYREIIQKCSFTSMREVKNQFYSDEERALWRDSTPKIFRNGKSGIWKDWFTVQQSEQFDEIFQKEMKTSSLKFGCDPLSKCQ